MVFNVFLYYIFVLKPKNSLEHQIKVMEARNDLVKSLEVCNKKKAWMEFEDLYIKHQELQTDLKKANEYALLHCQNWCFTSFKKI